MGGAGGSNSCGTTTYASFGMMFFSKYCVSCHNGYGTQSGVKSAAAAIKSRTVTSTNMPQGNNKPTTAERTQLGAWIDCGLP